jgi:hypothetical protein
MTWTSNVICRGTLLRSVRGDCSFSFLCLVNEGERWLFIFLQVPLHWLLDVIIFLFLATLCISSLEYDAVDPWIQLLLYPMLITCIFWYIWFVCLIVFNATFNNVSVILWWSVLLVEDLLTRVPGKNHRLQSHTLSQNVVSSSPRHEHDVVE